MSCRDEYRHWPFLTDEEFTLACAFFDQRYVQAKLGPARKVLKIISRRTATTGGTYIEILRLLQPPKEDNDLALALESLGGFGRASAADTGMDVDMATDDDDQEVLRPQLWQNSNTHLPNYSLYAHQPYVTYEIHLHPTYRMPTLWFTLHDLPNGDATFDLDSVFRYLVPEDQKPRLREAGITGGISAAPHPVTDLPAFFIHPCQTKEAMESFDCPMHEYLMVWLGLVGGCVGLWVPPEMAQEQL